MSTRYLKGTPFELFANNYSARSQWGLVGFFGQEFMSLSPFDCGQLRERWAPSLNAMASGTKQHFGLTVLSSNATEDGVTANYDNVTRKGGITGAGVAKINGKIGNRALFNSYEEENNPNPLGEPDARGLPPPKMAVKIGDVYADGFISKKDGAGLFLDLGADALKFESKYVDLGIGARCDTFAPEPPRMRGRTLAVIPSACTTYTTSGRCDTGINVGRQGGRICFLGCGAEIIVGPRPALAEKKTLPLPACFSKRKKASTDANDTESDETSSRFGNVILRGFTAQWWYALHIYPISDAYFLKMRTPLWHAMRIRLPTPDAPRTFFAGSSS